MKILAFISVVAMLGSLTLFTIRRSIVSESTYMKAVSTPAAALEDHPYNYFMTMMSQDYIDRLSGILPESEILSEFKNACPESVFVSNITPIMKNIAAFLRGDAEEITSDLDIKDFRTGSSAFFLESSQKTANPEHRKLLRHFSHILSTYPESLLVSFVITRSEIADLEELRGVLSKMTRWTVILGGACAVSLALLLFNIRLLGVTLLVSGSLGILISVLTVVVSMVKTPVLFLTVIVHEIIKSSMFLLSLESVIILLLGVSLILWTRTSPLRAGKPGGLIRTEEKT